MAGEKEQVHVDTTTTCTDSDGNKYHPVIGDGVLDTPEELMDREFNVSFFKRNFWDLWLQKIFRNLASMKFQLLIILYIPVVWGMFTIRPGTTEPWISAALGLGFLGGGYVTLATSRIISQTSLVEKPNKEELNTES
jgi:hypothetical protein